MKIDDDNLHNLHSLLYPENKVDDITGKIIRVFFN